MRRRREGPLLPSDLGPTIKEPVRRSGAARRLKPSWRCQMEEVVVLDEDAAEAGGRSLRFDRRSPSGSASDPVVGVKDSKGKAKELSQWESDLRKQEADIKRREEALRIAGVPMENKN
ncbi:hypothetical protein PR202_ga22841 [Eleusine coracana subsp. coracana]|uniref:Uncharacterized protein n=1 Tax=Eleusine coracana subsp. coracana TaxID=191504 RepID=A0AAV5D583_ELECO|nr:hypothetical protein PR202_ga22841 [Eleusine coracana subsp. coracana]